MNGIEIVSLVAFVVGIIFMLPVGVMGISNFEQIPMREEGLEKFYRWLDDFAALNTAFADKKSLGTSEEGRDIPAVFVTNKSISDHNKQIAIVTLARHVGVYNKVRYREDREAK